MANWYGRICQLQPRKILKRVESSFSKRYFTLLLSNLFSQSGQSILQEFGILDPHQILYKFAIYAFEVKHEQKFECGFVSFNEVPLHCQIAFMVNLDADGGAGKVIFEKNCLLKSFLGCHYFSFKKDHSLRLNSSTSGYFH